MNRFLALVMFVFATTASAAAVPDSFTWTTGPMILCNGASTCNMQQPDALTIAAGGITNTMLAGSIANAKLLSSSVTVNPGTGLSGGGAVSLGGAVTLTNTGVVSLVAVSPLSSTGGQSPTLSLGVVPIANGGTGISSAPTSTTQVLHANAAGNGWMVSPLSAVDIPSLSGTYVALIGSQVVSGAKTFSSPITGSITGNAATVTNGLYATGLYSDPMWISSLSAAKITGDIAGNAVGFTDPLFGDVTGTQSATVVGKLRGTPLSVTFPGVGQVMRFDGSEWAPATPAVGTVTSVTTGAGLAGGPITSSGTLSIPGAGVTNTMLQNSGITVSAMTGLSGGGAVSLGGSVFLSVTTTGVTVGSYPNTSGSVFFAVPKVTVNAQGQITAATTGQLDASAIAGTLASFRGGTGVSGSLINTVLGATSSGGWVARKVEVTDLATAAVSFYAGDGLEGGGTAVLGTSRTLSIAAAGVSNTMLANSQVTYGVGYGLTGGGTVSLGGSASIGLDLTAANHWTGEQTFDRATFGTGALHADRVSVRGSPVEIADFAPSPEWGSAAYISYADGNDSRGRVVVNAGGGGFAANPSVKLTFKDGPWSAPPTCSCKLDDTSASPWTSLCGHSVATDALTIYYGGNNGTNAVPDEGLYYVISYTCDGND
jgi:hypothetical protein